MLETLWDNIEAGARLALLRPSVQRADFTVSVEQVVLLLVVGNTLVVAFDILLQQLYHEVALESRAYYLSVLATEVTAAFLIAVIQRSPLLGPTLFTVWMSIAPTMFLAVAVITLAISVFGRLGGSQFELAILYAMIVVFFPWMIIVGRNSIHCVFETSVERSVLLFVLAFVMFCYLPDVIVATLD